MTVALVDRELVGKYSVIVPKNTKARRPEFRGFAAAGRTCVSGGLAILANSWLHLPSWRLRSAGQER
jgi:hypothetical protein